VVPVQIRRTGKGPHRRAAYSPDLNPIEEAFSFSKIKGLMRKAEARSREALLEAIGAAISALSAQDARGFFEHCGYRAMVQLF
jgi:transposase